MIATFAVKSLTGEQLFARRKKSDEEKWALAFPKIKTQTFETDNFRFVASADTAPVEPLAKNFDAQLPLIFEQLGLAKDLSLIHI